MFITHDLHSCIWQMFFHSVHSRHTFSVPCMGIEPMTFALLMQCSTRTRRTLSRSTWWNHALVSHSWTGCLKFLKMFSRISYICPSLVWHPPILHSCTISPSTIHFSQSYRLWLFFTSTVCTFAWESKKPQWWTDASLWPSLSDICMLMMRWNAK